MSASIGATRERVWRALTDPQELVSWDERMLAPVTPLDSYPEAGQHMRWRYKLGSLSTVLHDRPLEVVPPERLHTTLSVGSMRLDQTLTLHAEKRVEGPRTRVGVKVVAENSVPLIGAVVDRFEVRRLASEHANSTLQLLQRWLESEASQPALTGRSSTDSKPRYRDGKPSRRTSTRP